LVTGVQTCALPIYAYGNPIKYYGNEDLVLKQNGCSHTGPLEELFV